MLEQMMPPLAMSKGSRMGPKSPPERIELVGGANAAYSFVRTVTITRVAPRYQLEAP